MARPHACSPDLLPPRPAVAAGDPAPAACPPPHRAAARPAGPRPGAAQLRWHPAGGPRRGGAGAADPAPAAFAIAGGGGCHERRGPRPVAGPAGGGAQRSAGAGGGGVAGELAQHLAAHGFPWPARGGAGLPVGEWAAGARGAATPGAPGGRPQRRAAGASHAPGGSGAGSGGAPPPVGGRL